MEKQAAGWEVYAFSAGHETTVTGALRIWRGLHSPQLNADRDMYIYLPPSYHTDKNRRYPVIYMHDGQNLFDAATAFAGAEWHVDETMEMLAAEGVEAIIAAVAHGGEQRVAEYNPFPHVWRGRGQLYLDFLEQTLKPLVDRDFRTLPDRAHTGILGSSMGGLISLYAFFHRAETFGLCGAMSPSFWIGHGAIYANLQDMPVIPGKIYLDNGTRETSARRMFAFLKHKGFECDTALKYVVDPEAEHTESAWARRLPDALRFLLG